MLYNLYRPRRFLEVLGQPTSVGLRNSIKSGKVLHTILLSGPRGCGKTTLARIYAKALNCAKPRNGEPCQHCKACRKESYLEKDCGEFNDLKEVQKIKSWLRSAPEFKYQVLILDEAHILNPKTIQPEILKILEEPPEKSVILLVTTNPDALSSAIRSRCSWWPVLGVPLDKIMERLLQVSRNEKLKISKQAIKLIATEANGSVRDSLSLLEGLVNYNRPISESFVRTILTVADVDRLVLCIVSGDTLGSAKEVERLFSVYSVRTVFSALAKRFNQMSVDSMSEGEDTEGLLYNKIATIFDERGRQKTLSELTHGQLTVVGTSLLTRNQETTSDLWLKFVLSVEVGVDGGFYPKELLSEVPLLHNVKISKGVVTYEHFLDVEVSESLKSAFAEFSEQTHKWRRNVRDRLLRKIGTDKKSMAQGTHKIRQKSSVRSTPTRTQRG